MWTYEQLHIIDTIQNVTLLHPLTTVAVHGPTGTGKSQIANFCVDNLGVNDFWSSSRNNASVMLADQGHLLQLSDIQSITKPMVLIILCDFYLCDFNLAAHILQQRHTILKHLTISFSLSTCQCNFLNTFQPRRKVPTNSEHKDEHELFEILGEYRVTPAVTNCSSRSICVWKYVDHAELHTICQKLSIAKVASFDTVWCHSGSRFCVFHPFDVRLEFGLGYWKAFSLLVRACTNNAEKIILLQMKQQIPFVQPGGKYTTVTAYTLRHVIPTRLFGGLKNILQLPKMNAERHLNPVTVGLVIEYALHFYMQFKRKPPWTIWIRSAAEDSLEYLNHILTRCITLLNACNFSLNKVEYQERLSVFAGSSRLVGVPDFIIDNCNLVELKVAKAVQPDHVTQAAVYWYLLHLSRPWVKVSCIFLNPIVGIAAYVDCESCFPQLASFINATI